MPNIMLFWFSEDSQSFLKSNRTCKTEVHKKILVSIDYFFWSSGKNFKIQKFSCAIVYHYLKKKSEEIKTAYMHAANLYVNVISVPHKKLHAPSALVNEGSLQSAL